MPKEHLSSQQFSVCGSTVFETKRLVIKKATPDDAPLFYQLWTDPQVMANVGFPQGLRITLEEIEEKIRLHGDTLFSHLLVVRLKETGDAIGECKMHAPNDVGIAETDVKLLPDYWGHKYGVEIKRGLVKYLFTKSECLIVQATPNVNNVASIKMQEAVGGRRVGEGTFEFPEEMGAYTKPVPHYVYHVFREEWEEAQEQSRGPQEKSVSGDVNLIGRAFANGLERILGKKLVGAYIYGAAAFPDAVPTGDVDFHVILLSELTEHERSRLEALHDSLAERFPPLGAEMDGYYILLENARQTSPPRSQMWAHSVDNAWALHREHVLAGRCLVLIGPDPGEIYPPASWPEIERALFDELAYVEKHLHVYPDYCILNLCRLLYSFETKNVVVSKAQTAKWAMTALPEWSRLVELAMKSYAGQATAEDRGIMLDRVTAFLDFARSRIEGASG